MSWGLSIALDSDSVTWTRLLNSEVKLSCKRIKGVCSSVHPITMSTFTEAWIPGPKSLSFYTRTYTPATGSPRGVVVFIHGFIEHVARYEHVHKRWAEKGFVIFTFDQRGFGRTALDPKKSAGSVYGRTGDTDQIPDIEWALRVAQEANPTVPLFLMGHSMVSLSLFILCVVSG